MSVYVDDMRMRAQVGRCRPANWSHLQADTHDELMEFATRLGLRPSWLQKPGTVIEHFDVTDTVRAKALQLGAIPITYGGQESKDLIRRKMAERREAAADAAERAS